MQVSVEESGVIERRLTVSVPHAEVDREIAKRLRKVAKRARIPGFRPGKAPPNLIDQRYRAQVTNEVISDTIHASYREALGKEAIVPAGLVSIEPKPFVAGDDLQYVATIELFPKIPSPTLAGRTIEKPVCAVTAEDVERTLEDIRKRNANFIAKDGADGGDSGGKSETGDRLTIDFDGTIDGRPFAGGTLKNHQFVLGEGHPFAPFDTDLLALKAGDGKQVAFTFPPDYPGTEVAGKAVEFAVTVKAVERRILPEADAAFAEKLGIAEGGMAKMREEIETSLKRELAARMRAVLRDRVMDELMKVNEIEAPKALVEGEIERRVRALGERLAAQGAPKKDIEEIRREPFAGEARRQVILGLIAADIIEKSALKPDAKLVRERIEEMATGYDDGEALVNWHYADPARLQRIEAMVLEEQMVARMLETATVTEKRVSFKAFMDPNPQR